uniref:Uncharacterized protein n=1 Tax=Anguilla anguilla TaxID=7936 RepID=A0A0E9SL00_ANGAN
MTTAYEAQFLFHIFIMQNNINI